MSDAGQQYGCKLGIAAGLSQLRLAVAQNARERWFGIHMYACMAAMAAGCVLSNSLVKSGCWIKTQVLYQWIAEFRRGILPTTQNSHHVAIQCERGQWVARCGLGVWLPLAIIFGGCAVDSPLCS